MGGTTDKSVWGRGVPLPFLYLGFPGGSDPKESACKTGDRGSIPGSGRSPGKGNGRQPIPVFLPWKSHGQKSLVGYSLWGHRVRHDQATKTTTTSEVGWALTSRGQRVQKCSGVTGKTFVDGKDQLLHVLS